MPAGHRLIEAVAEVIRVYPEGTHPKQIAGELHDPRYGQRATTRAIRYAIAELIKSGRAKRKGQNGPVYAVGKETT